MIKTINRNSNNKSIFEIVDNFKVKKERDFIEFWFDKKSIPGIKIPSPKSSRKIETIETIETSIILLLSKLILEYTLIMFLIKLFKLYVFCVSRIGFTKWFETICGIFYF